MIAVEVDVEALVRTRFALSPAAEAVLSARQALAGGPSPAPGWWLRRARRVLCARAPLLAHLVAPDGWWLPDFLVMPGSASASVDDELAAIAATGADEVAADLDAMFRGRPVPPFLVGVVPGGATGLDRLRRPLPRVVARALRGGEGGLARAAADALDAYWHGALEPDWPEIKQVLDDDIAARSRILAREGTAAALCSLHPDLAWADGTLRISSRYAGCVATRGRAIVLRPSAFGLVRAGIAVRPGSAPVVFYPAHGAFQVWSDRGRCDALAQLLGRTRAAILAELDHPATTSQLAARHRLSLAAVSRHLHILHHARLATRRRDRREVLYMRAPLGDALVAEADGRRRSA
jgi:DNA-binding transcriptional ArsR family regulator